MRPLLPELSTAQLAPHLLAPLTSEDVALAAWASALPNASVEAALAHVSTNATHHRPANARDEVSWPSPGVIVVYSLFITCFLVSSFFFAWWVSKPRPSDLPLDRPEDELEAPPANGEVKDVILSVDGMHCSACVGVVEETLLEVNGVVQASVSLVSKSAKVTFDGRTSTDRLVGAVADIGFACRVVHGSEMARTAFDSDRHEVATSVRLFLGSLLFTGPILLIMVADATYSVAKQQFGYFVAPGLTLQDLLLVLLSTPVQFGFGLRFYRSAYYATRNGQANMDVLIALGSTAAYFSGLVLMIISMIDTSQSQLSKMHSMIDAAPVLITTILGGKALESAARGQATSSLRALVALQPRTAILCPSLSSTSFEAKGSALGRTLGLSTSKSETTSTADDRRQVAAEDLKVGDVIYVPPGSRLPVDGLVIEGSSSVDASMLTGESVAVPKAKNSRVLGGTLNKHGGLHVLVTAPSSTSTVAQITKLVADAQYRRPKVQAVVDVVAAYFVPGVIITASATFIVWVVMGAMGSLPRDYYISCDEQPDSTPSPVMLAYMFAIAVLVSACPCALGLATPTTVVIGSAIATRLGILIKGGDVIETASTVDTVLFDKTGTLTSAGLSVDGMATWSAARSEAELLRLAAAVERGSTHPIGVAIVHHASQKRIEGAADVTQSVAVAGGVSSRVEGAEVLLGSRELMTSRALQLTESQEADVARAQGRGLTVALMATEEKGAMALVGMFGLRARLGDDAQRAVAWLTAQGVECWMATGDNRAAADAIAAAAGIHPSRVLAEMTPAAKLAKVEELKAAGKIVAVVGDGVNDAPSLAYADVGIAVARGEDVAVEAADVVLMKSAMCDVCRTLDLSRVSMGRIRTNLGLAALYNALIIPLSAGAFYPVLQWQISPMQAGFAMALSSVLVVCSSLLLYCYSPPAALSAPMGEDGP